ncbi:transcriptional regulator [Stagonosporopsis vannaccii]|nr:transcriptional regulator [Stagonosporopsis vannaccii]
MGEQGVRRVDAADIALAITNAIDDDSQRWGGGGQKVYVGELKTYTAHDTARLWSEVLSRGIKPALSDRAGFDELEYGFGQIAGPAWGRDLRLIHKTLAERGFKITEVQYEQQVALLGKHPESCRSSMLSSPPSGVESEP